MRFWKSSLDQCDTRILWDLACGFELVGARPISFAWNVSPSLLGRAE